MTTQFQAKLLKIKEIIYHDAWEGDTEVAP